jgi:hypothetical protein
MDRTHVHPGHTFHREETGMIRRLDMTIWEHPTSPDVHPADEKYPNQEPPWDSNHQVHQAT